MKKQNNFMKKHFLALLILFMAQAHSGLQSLSSKHLQPANTLQAFPSNIDRDLQVKTAHEPQAEKPEVQFATDINSGETTAHSQAEDTSRTAEDQKIEDQKIEDQKIEDQKIEDQKREKQKLELSFEKYINILNDVFILNHETEEHQEIVEQNIALCEEIEGLLIDLDDRTVENNDKYIEDLEKENKEIKNEIYKIKLKLSSFQHKIPGKFIPSQMINMPKKITPQVNHTFNEYGQQEFEALSNEYENNLTIIDSLFEEVEKIYEFIEKNENINKQVKEKLTNLDRYIVSEIRSKVEQFYAEKNQEGLEEINKELVFKLSSIGYMFSSFKLKEPLLGKLFFTNK